MHTNAYLTCKCFISNDLHGSKCVTLLFVEGENWITLEIAAQRLHIGIDTMRRWVRQGHFPRTKVGKRYLIPIKAIDEFLESRLEYGARPVTPRKRTATAKKPKSQAKS